MKDPELNLVSRLSSVRRVLYLHFALVVCLGGLACCDLPAFRSLGKAWWGGWINTVALLLAYGFPGMIALKSIGRLPVWRCLLVLLVDFVLAVLQLAIVMLMELARTGF
jgi:hypothetical protein